MGSPLLAIARPDVIPIRIAANVVVGVEDENKFGRNPAISTATVPEDIWSGGGVYEFITELSGGSQDSGVQLKISSDSTDDDVGGTGATSVEIFGLDANYVEQNEIIAMDGQTAVTSTGTYTRIHRIIVLAAGSGDENAGILYAGTGNLTTGVPDNIYAVVSVGDNQTLMAIYTIPAGKTGFLTGWYATINKTASAAVADLQVRSRPEGEVFQVKAHHAVINTGSSHFFHKDAIPLRLAEKTDIKIHCVSVSANNMDISAGFNVTLLTN